MNRVSEHSVKSGDDERGSETSSHRGGKTTLDKHSHSTDAQILRFHFLSLTPGTNLRPLRLFLKVFIAAGLKKEKTPQIIPGPNGIPKVKSIIAKVTKINNYKKDIYIYIF